jgi:hypothetical protein
MGLWNLQTLGNLQCKNTWQNVFLIGKYYGLSCADPTIIQNPMAAFRGFMGHALYRENAKNEKNM